MGRLIDADKLMRKAQRVAVEAWKMKTTASIETTLNQFIDWIKSAPTIDVPTWIPFEIRPTDDEEREFFKSDIILVSKLPDDGDEILVSCGKWVWQDTFVRDELGAWLDSYGEIEDGMAWMPLPKPYEEGDHE